MPVPAFVRSRRFWIAAGTAALALLAFVLVWFQPQKLFIDKEVDEAAPAAAATNAPGPEVLGRGTLVGLNHEARGNVVLLRSGDETTLRFEDFEVENGPDLFVYLSAGEASGPQRALGDDFVDLGPLKGNIGAQNYTVPPGTDLERYDTAVVWCRRFTVAFAAAEIA